MTSKEFIADKCFILCLVLSFVLVFPCSPYDYVVSCVLYRTCCPIKCISCISDTAMLIANETYVDDIYAVTIHLNFSNTQNRWLF